jgi:hypothetical protein
MREVAGFFTPDSTQQRGTSKPCHRHSPVHLRPFFVAERRGDIFLVVDMRDLLVLPATTDPGPEASTRHVETPVMFLRGAN